MSEVGRVCEAVSGQQNGQNGQSRRYQHLNPDLLVRIRQIKLLIMDVDGVLSDGTVYYGAGGEVAKAFYVRDGLGLKNLMRHGVEAAVISGRPSAGTHARLSELGVQHIHLGIGDKVACYAELKRQLQIEDHEVAYIGDDLPDFEMIKLVGLGVAVADAEEEILAIADYVTTAVGGRGAVRELCDLIRQVQKQA